MLRVLELFAGIGACSKALTNLGIEHEIVDAVEIDKYAIKSFNAIHSTNFEPQDITTWNKDIKADLIMHGSPCQDFSVAGKQAGGDKDSGTRSSLMYETLRIVEKLKPKYVIWENVKNLLSAKHRHNFDAYLEAMERLGYHSQYQVLNAKDYGVPQNRERVFTVSIRNDLDVDFKFPEPQELTIRLKDVLEPQVDEKYYLSDEQVSKIKLWEDRQKENGRGFRFNTHDGDDIATTMTTSADRPSTSNYYKDPKCVRESIVIGDYNQRVRADQDTMGTLATNCGVGAPRNGFRIAEPQIIDPQGRLKKINEPKDYSPTLRAQTHGNEPCVLEPKEVSKTVRASGRGSLDKHSWDIVLEPQTALEQPVDRDYKKHGKVRETQYEVKNDGVSHALRTNGETLAVEPIKIKTANIKGYDEASDGDAIDLQYPESKMRRGRVGHGVSKTLMGADSMGTIDNYRIRKLTPKECWRLMGFSDEDFEKAQSAGISNSQLYKQAGNSIVVDVLMAILNNLIGGKDDDTRGERNHQEN